MVDVQQRHKVLRGVLIGVVLAALLALLAACGSDDPTATPTPRPVDTGPTPTSDAPAKAAWEIEWEETLAKAQAEGELAAALGGGATRRLRPYYTDFQERFGIKVILSGGSGSEASARILAERAAGQYTVDVTMTGASSANDVFVPNNALDPVEPLLFLPDILDKSNWFNGQWWWGDLTHKYVFLFAGVHDDAGIFINTDLVNVDDINSYWDILDPKYNGLHVSSDLVASSMTTFLYGTPGLGPDFLRRYVLETDLTMVADARIAGAWLTEGIKGFGMFFGGNLSTLIDELEERGAPVLAIRKPMAEGTRLHVSSGHTFMALNRPPHPNAQKLFANWLLSKEGQLMAQNIDKEVDSFRIDIPKDMVDPELRRREGFPYIFVPTDPHYQGLLREAQEFGRDLARQWRAQQ